MKTLRAPYGVLPMKPPSEPSVVTLTQRQPEDSGSPKSNLSEHLNQRTNNMTQIYLAGGENPSHQQILSACGATHLSVNVTSLLRRKTFSWELDLPHSAWEWVAYCDGPASIDDLHLVADSAAKQPRWVIGPESWSDWGDNYLPLWNGEGSIPANRSSGLVVTDRVFRDKSLLRRAQSSRTAGNSLGVITGSIDESINKFDLVISAAWWSAMKYGETQIWDGRRMHRFNAERKNEIRTRYSSEIALMGVDADQVLLDDPEEVARLAVSSWMFYSDHLSGAKVLSFPSVTKATTAEDSESAETGSEAGALDTRPPVRRHHAVLPVIGMTTITSTERLGDGTEIIEEQALVQTSSVSMRQCDNCFLASSGCPGFQAGASCAYSIPVEIRSKDQLQAVMQAMVEMQTQRVLQARFAEEITGQELTPEVGKELDRLFSSVEKMRDIMDNRDTVKVTMEARGRSGVLSRLFGDRVGANAKMLSQPVDSDDVIDALVDED